MASGLDSRPSASTLDVESLVQLAWEGKVRVPHFQRDFRWGFEDIRRLFDSVVKGYPIGSLLLWLRAGTAELVRLGALGYRRAATSEARWVVDGQQRLTSLANVLHPEGQRDPRFALAYDLRKSDFVRTPAIEDPLVVPLPVLFDLQLLLAWFADNPELRIYLDEATQITRKLRQYVVPLYIVDEDDPAILQDIFDRMNNYGKRLSRAEIFSALNAGDEADSGSGPTFDSIAEGIQLDLDFGLIDNDTVLAVILARRGPNRRDIRHEFDKKDDEGRDSAYENGEAALRRAIRFLQVEASVPHVTMLAYKYLLIVLSRYFSFFPEPDARTVQLLRRWYWRAAMAGPEQFKGGTPNAARLLCSQIVEGQMEKSVHSLLGAITQPSRSRLVLDRFSTREATTKMFLCAYWSLSPCDFADGQPFTSTDLASALGEQQTARSISAQLAPAGSVDKGVSGLPGNRLLYPSIDADPRELPEFAASSSTTFASQTWDKVLASHAISREAALEYSQNHFEAAVMLRQVDMQLVVDNFTTRATEWDFDDSPSIDSLILDDDDFE